MTDSSRASINMTPLIDILLVLLIIFMVITPTTSYGLEAAIPRPAGDSTPAREDAVVIRVAANGELTLNRRGIARDELAKRLRQHRTVFIQGAPEAEYQRVAEIIDVARGAGVGTIGLMRVCSSLLHNYPGSTTASCWTR